MVCLVTGASGLVGREVIGQLMAAGVPVRAAVREPNADPGRDHEELAFDFDHPGGFAAALHGVDRVFLMRPPAISDVKRYLRPFIAACTEAHVRQVVFLSVMGVNRALPHWQVERDLEASGLPHTFVRPAFFTQNLATAYRDDIRSRSRIRLPAGSGRTSFIDTRDVATVIVEALKDPGTHAGRGYTLTGPRGWTYDQVVALLSAELQRDVRYERVGFLRYRSELRRQRLPSGFVWVQLMINAVARLGLAGKVTPTFADLIGREPISLPSSLHHLRKAWL